MRIRPECAGTVLLEQPVVEPAEDRLEEEDDENDYSNDRMVSVQLSFY